MIMLTQVKTVAKAVAGQNIRFMLLIAVLMSSIGVAQAEEDPPPPSAVITGTLPARIDAGQPISASFSAVVNNPPKSTKECKITGGPNWKWTVDADGADLYCSPDDQSSTTVGGLFDSSGSYTVTVSVEVSYTTDNCGDITASDSKDFEIEVLAKEWDPDEEIQGGIIIKPSNQTDPNIYEAPIVAPGTSLQCEVTPATDKDSWVKGEQTGYDNDEMTYRWVCDMGGFSNGGIGRSVRWYPPSFPGGITLDVVIKCIIDDRPKEIGEYDDGDRDDEEVVRETVVEVQAATGSEIGFKLYRVAADGGVGEEITQDSEQKLGGKVWLVLLMKVGAFERVAEKVKSLTAVVREEGNEHPGLENHVELTFPLEGAAGEVVKWEKQVNGQWLPEGGNPKEPNLAAQATQTPPPNYYRVKRLWDTTREWKTSLTDNSQPRLMGHNGRHTVELVKVTTSENTGDGETGPPMLFRKQRTDGSWDEPYTFNVAPDQREISNLVIASAETGDGNKDYFKFDPDSTDSSLQHPTVSFSIQDDAWNVEEEGKRHRYKWYVWAKPTRDEQNSVALTGILNEPGSQTVTINADNPGGYTQDHALGEWGTYTFDVRVQEIAHNSEAGVDEPWVDLRSTKLSFAQHHIDFAIEGEDGVKAQVGYRVDDQNGTNANEIKVDLLDPNFDLRASESVDGEQGISHNDIDLHTFDDSDFAVDSTGDHWIAIFTAEDDHGKDYRDHQNKRVAVVNKGKPKYFHIEEDWIKQGGVTYKALSESPRLAKTWAKSGWIVQSTGVSGSHDILDLDTQGGYAGWQIPQHYNTRTYDSRNSFDHYAKRNKNRFVHVLGAPFAEAPDLYGISDPDTDMEQWSYTFVGTLKAAYAKNGSLPSTDVEPIIKTTIHEVGHQFLLQHHPDDEPGAAMHTFTGKQCVMSEGFPSSVGGFMGCDYWFCNRHAGELSRYNWPTTP